MLYVTVLQDVALHWAHHMLQSTLCCNAPHCICILLLSPVPQHPRVRGLSEHGQKVGGHATLAFQIPTLLYIQYLVRPASVATRTLVVWR